MPLLALPPEPLPLLPEPLPLLPELLPLLPEPLVPLTALELPEEEELPEVELLETELEGEDEAELVATWLDAFASIRTARPQVATATPPMIERRAAVILVSTACRRLIA